MNSRADFLVGIFLAIFGLWVFIQAGEYSSRGVNSYGPNFWPQVLASLLVAASLILLWQTWSVKPLHWITSIDRSGFIQVATAIAVSIAYVFSMEQLGFLLSSFIFMFIMVKLLGHGGWIKPMAVAAGVTLVIYGIFHLFLKIPMPHGIFEVIT